MRAIAFRRGAASTRINAKQPYDRFLQYPEPTPSMVSRACLPFALTVPPETALGDAGAQVVFRGIGMKRYLGTLQDLQEFVLAAVKPHQEFVEFLIAGADF